MSDREKRTETIGSIRTTPELKARYLAALEARSGPLRSRHTRLIEEALDAFLGAGDDEFGPLSREDRDLLRVGRDFAQLSRVDLARALVLLFQAATHGDLDAVLAPAEALARSRSPAARARTPGTSRSQSERATKKPSRRPGKR